MPKSEHRLSGGGLYGPYDSDDPGDRVTERVRSLEVQLSFVHKEFQRIWSGPLETINDLMQIQARLTRTLERLEEKIGDIENREVGRMEEAARETQGMEVASGMPKNWYKNLPRGKARKGGKWAENG